MEQNQARVAGAAIGCDSREKYWGELDATEKVERMREEVKAWQRKCEYLGARVEALMHHVHTAAGGIAVPIDRAANGRDVEPWRQYGLGDDVRF